MLEDERIWDDPLDDELIADDLIVDDRIGDDDFGFDRDIVEKILPGYCRRVFSRFSRIKL